MEKFEMVTLVAEICVCFCRKDRGKWKNRYGAQVQKIKMQQGSTHSSELQPRKRKRLQRRSGKSKNGRQGPPSSSLLSQNWRRAMMGEVLFARRREVRSQGRRKTQMNSLYKQQSRIQRRDLMQRRGRKRMQFFHSGSPEE